MSVLTSRKHTRICNELRGFLSQGYTVAQFAELTGTEMSDITEVVNNDPELQNMIVSVSKLMDKAYTLKHVHGDPKAFNDLESKRNQTK